MSKKQVIKLKQNQLRQIVIESVNRTVAMLRESDNSGLENKIRKIWVAFDRLRNEIESNDRNYSIHAVNLKKAMNGDEKAKDNIFFWIKTAIGVEDYILDTVFEAWCKKNGVLKENADYDNFNEFDSLEATRVGSHKKRRGVKTKGSTENRDFLRQQTAKGNPIIKYKRNPKEWVDNLMNQSDDKINLSESKISRIVKESLKHILKESLNKADGINILKEVSEVYLQLKEIEKDMSEFYKRTGYKPDGTSWYRCRNRLFELMGMNRGSTLNAYVHPFIDSLAEIMYNYGLTVNDVVSLNIQPFNEIDIKKLENAFSKYKNEMDYGERLQHYYDMMSTQQASFEDNSEYVSKTTGVPEDEL